MGAASRLRNIQEEMDALLEEAMEIVQHEGMRIDVARARVYWYPRIKKVLWKETEFPEFLGGSMFTMQGAIEDMDEDAEFDTAFGYEEVMR